MLEAKFGDHLLGRIQQFQLMLIPRYFVYHDIHVAATNDDDDDDDHKVTFKSKDCHKLTTSLSVVLLRRLRFHVIALVICFS